MDNEYNAYEPEENKNKKLKITRGMLILAGAALILIIALIIFVAIKNATKPKKITTADYHYLEKRMEEEAPSYITDEITESPTRVELMELLEENGGVLNKKEIPAISVCDGYVEVYLEDKEEIAKAYISCNDGYKTTGYDDGSGDVTKPVITLKGKDEVVLNQGDRFVDPGATATDNTDGDLTKKIVVNGKVDTSIPGTYIIKYSVQDSSGNKTTKKRTVVVNATTTTTTIATTTTTTARNVATKKYRATTTKSSGQRVTTRATTQRITTPPTITLRGSNPYTITQGQIYTDPGFSARDALGKDLTSRVTKSGTVNPNTAKTYYIIYSVKDDYGNTGSATRIVKVTAKSNVTGLTVSPNTVTISVGGKIKITAIPNYTGSAPTITWKSSNTTVATVSSNGTVTGLKKGSATISATAGSKVASCSLTVK